MIFGMTASVMGVVIFFYTLKRRICREVKFFTR